MIESTSASIVALTAHAREVGAGERLRFAERLREWLPPGSVVFETCHRVEGYTVREGHPPADAHDPRVPAGGVTLVGAAAVRHAVEVAAGRDSIVEGEEQILHQLRATIEQARRSADLDPVLDRLFGVALGAGRRARSWRSGPRRSLADLALRIIEDRVGALRGRPLLVVGAGTIGRLTARAAAALGAEVVVASRSEERARELARMTGARAEGFDPGGSLGAMAGIVVALGGPWTVGPKARGELTAGSAVVVDLSQPAAIPPAMVDVLGSRLVTADDVARIGAQRSPGRERSRARMDGLIDGTTEGFLAWLAGRSGRDAAALLVDHADREREAELAELWRRHPGFGPEARAEIEAMTRHLSRRILREPLERLGRDADGRGAQAARDLFSL